jgi:hypothetical protein
MAAVVVVAAVVAIMEEEVGTVLVVVVLLVTLLRHQLQQEKLQRLRQINKHVRTVQHQILMVIVPQQLHLQTKPHPRLLHPKLRLRQQPQLGMRQEQPLVVALQHLQLHPQLLLAIKQLLHKL